MTISQPAGSPHASALSQKTEAEKEEESTQPQAISINTPEHGGWRSVRVFPGHMSTPEDTFPEGWRDRLCGTTHEVSLVGEGGKNIF